MVSARVSLLRLGRGVTTGEYVGSLSIAGLVPGRKRKSRAIIIIQDVGIYISIRFASGKLG